MDAASIGALGGSLLTLATVLWRGGAMSQTLKNVETKVDKINGSVDEHRESTSACQARQSLCPHAQPQEMPKA